MLKTLLENEIAAGLPALAGAEVRGRLPLRERTLNDALRALAATRWEIPAGLSLRVLAGNRIAVDGLPIPGLLRWAVGSPTLAIEPISESDDGLRQTLRLEGTVGILSALLAPLTAALGGRLPPFVVVQGSVITVDIRAALAEQGVGDLARHVRRVRVATAPGCLTVDFHVRVDGPAAPSPPARPEG